MIPKPVSQSELKSTLLRTGLVTVSTLLVTGMNLVSRVMVIRLTSTEDFGLYMACFSFFMLVAAFTQLGLWDGLTRFVAQHYGRGESNEAAALFRDSIRFLTLVAVVTGVGLALASEWIAKTILQNPVAAVWIPLMAIALPFYVLTMLTASYYQGQGIVIFKALIVDSSRLGTFLATLMLFSLLWPSGGFPMLIIAFVSGIVVSAVLTGSFGFRLWRENLPTQTSDIKKLLRYSVPLVTLIMAGLVVSSVNVLLLNYFHDATQVAFYSALLTVSSLFIFSSNMLETVLMPLFTSLQAAGRNIALQRMYWTMTRWNLLLLTVMGWVVFTFADELLEIAFSMAYREISLGLRLVILFALFHISTGPSDPAMRVLDNTRSLIIIRLFTSAGMLASGIFFAPSLGYLGMVLAWGIGVLMINIGYLIILFRANVLSSIPRNLLLYCCLCYGVVVLPATLSGGRIGLAMVLFLVGFAVILLVFYKMMTEEDRMVQKWLINRFRIKI